MGTLIASSKRSPRLRTSLRTPVRKACSSWITHFLPSLSLAPEQQQLPQPTRPFCGRRRVPVCHARAYAEGMNSTSASMVARWPRLFLISFLAIIISCTGRRIRPGALLGYNTS